MLSNLDKLITGLLIATALPIDLYALINLVTYKFVPIENIGIQPRGALISFQFLFDKNMQYVLINFALILITCSIVIFGILIFETDAKAQRAIIDFFELVENE